MANSTYRYERKYLCPEYDRSDLEQFIKSHPYFFEEIYYQRRVNSVYFDTPNLDYYYLNFLGSPERKKVRVRWYTHKDKNSPLQLEIKVRENEVMKKVVIPLEKFKLKNPKHDPNFIQNLTEAVCFALKDKLQESQVLLPQLINSYQRSYFLSDQLGMRITVDTDLDFFSAQDWQREKVTATFATPILECKYEVANDTNLNHVVQSLPIRISKSSKYVMGTQLINPEY